MQEISHNDILAWLYSRTHFTHYGFAWDVTLHTYLDYGVTGHHQTNVPNRDCQGSQSGLHNNIAIKFNICSSLLISVTSNFYRKAITLYPPLLYFFAHGVNKSSAKSNGKPRFE
jgi:hypothetical protein